jgi:hypothetical protein
VSTCFALGGYGTDALLAFGRVGFFIFVLALGAPPLLGLLRLAHHAQLLAIHALQHPWRTLREELRILVVADFGGNARLGFGV